MTEPNKRLQMLEAMIAKGTSDPFVYYARALELRGAGRREQALQALSETRDRFASYVPSYLAAGQLAIELPSGPARTGVGWPRRSGTRP